MAYDQLYISTVASSGEGSGSEELWAEHGLTGLVLLALFTLIGIFIRVLSKKDCQHQGFLERILEEERKERKETREENVSTNRRLADALDGLAEELKAKR